MLNLKKIVASIMTASMMASLVILPQTAHAAGNMPDYYDPATNWNHTTTRANELDTNAIIFEGPGLCNSDTCTKDTGGKPKETMFTNFRVPEYTPGGESNASRGVAWTDGTNGYKLNDPNQEDPIAGFLIAAPPNNGDLLTGAGQYTGHHWTKSYCQSCGGWNTNQGKSDTGFGKNMYQLNTCSSDFMRDVPTEKTVQISQIEQGKDPDYREYHHVFRYEDAKYCQFCYGTAYGRQVEEDEKHKA